MAEKPQDPKPKQPGKDPPPFPRPPDPSDKPPPDIKPVPPPDILPSAESEPPAPASLRDEWNARIQRTRSTMVRIPQDSEGWAGVRADILTRVTDFINRHKGHQMTYCRPTDDHEALQAACHTCQETMTVLLEYERKAH
jgi:hypothetical protein